MRYCSYGVGGAQPGQPDQLGVHLGLFDDERIAGSDGFDLGVGQAAESMSSSRRTVIVAAHDLGD